MKNKSIYALTLAAALTLGAATVTPTYAHEGDNYFQSFIERLSERFGLSQSDVESFISEERETRRQEREQEHQEHLNNLVETGVLTQDQKESLEAMHDQMHENREGWQELLRDDRMNLKHQHREQMRQWAENEGVDLELIRPNGHKFGKHDFK